MIEYYESATHLNISFNKHIGTRGWQAAAHMMRKVGTSGPQPLFIGPGSTALLSPASVPRYTTMWLCKPR